jgi:hypothetical protein
VPLAVPLAVSTSSPRLLAAASTPEPLPSLQVYDTVTSVLFQPLVFGPGVALALTIGAVASRLIVTDCELVPPALVAVQVRVVPAVSVLIVVVLQPLVEVIADSGSVTVQLTVTLLTYQPLLPRVPECVNRLRQLG